MHVSMMHISVVRLKFCYGRTDERTNGRTNKAILGVGRFKKIKKIDDDIVKVQG